MRSTLFLVELYRKKPAYFKVWFALLMKFKVCPNQKVSLTIPPDINRVTFYRIVDYGVELFGQIDSGFSMTRERNYLFVDEGPPLEKEIKAPSDKKPKPQHKILPETGKSEKAIKKTPPQNPKGSIKRPPKDTAYHEEVIKFFNETCIDLPEVKKLTPTRIKLINARLKEHGKEKIIEVIQKTASRPFLNGDNKTGWSANFDWIMNVNKFVKILENHYVSNGANSNQQRSDSQRKQSANAATDRLFNE